MLLAPAAAVRKRKERYTGKVCPTLQKFFIFLPPVPGGTRDYIKCKSAKEEEEELTALLGPRMRRLHFHSRSPCNLCYIPRRAFILLEREICYKSVFVLRLLAGSVWLACLVCLPPRPSGKGEEYTRPVRKSQKPTTTKPCQEYGEVGKEKRTPPPPRYNYCSPEKKRTQEENRRGTG